MNVEKDTVLKRIDCVQKEVSELRELGKLSLPEFTEGDGYKLAEYHLHRALEGVFNISAHLLSRLGEGGATKYREMAEKMGECGIVERDFAKTKLVEMAKYRNRLVHFYAEITAEELYGIVRDDLDDFDVFLRSVKDVFMNPAKYNLSVE